MWLVWESKGEQTRLEPRTVARPLGAIWLERSSDGARFPYAIVLARTGGDRVCRTASTEQSIGQLRAPMYTREPQMRRAARPPPRDRTVEPHHVADDLRHGLIVLGRDFLVELDGSMQGARQRRVLDDRNVVGGRHFADLARDQVGALGQA